MPGRAFDHETHHLPGIEPGAGDHRILDVGLERIGRIQHRGDAALGPVGGALVELALGQDADAGAFRQLQRDGEPARAAAQDQDVMEQAVVVQYPASPDA